MPAKAGIQEFINWFEVFVPLRDFQVIRVFAGTAAEIEYFSHKYYQTVNSGRTRGAQPLVPCGKLKMKWPKESSNPTEDSTFKGKNDYGQTG